MRVLFDRVSTFLPLWGGIEEHIVTLGRHLAAMGHEPLFLIRAEYDNDIRARLSTAGIRCIEDAALIAFQGRRPQVSQWLPALQKILRREQIDVLHIHSSLAGHEIWDAMAARAVRVPAIVCTYHGTPLVESRHRIASMFALHRLLRVRGIAPSLAVVRAVRAQYRPPREYLVHVQHGIDDLAGNTACEPSTSSNEVVVGAVSRLSREKGIDIFIAALALLNPSLPWRAVVVGDGDEMMHLQRQACELGIGHRVDFRGFVTQAADCLREFDIVAMPSRLEGFGLVAAEACAAARPIVATQVGGLVELVREQENGWLVPPDDPHAMAAAIGAAIQDGDRRSRMGAAGRKIFETRLRARLMAENTLAVYHRSLATRFHGWPAAACVAAAIVRAGV